MKLLKNPIGKIQLTEDRLVDVYNFDDICDYFSPAKVCTVLQDSVNNLTFKELLEGDKYFLEVNQTSNKELYLVKLFQVTLKNYQLQTTINQYFYTNGPTSN